MLKLNLKFAFTNCFYIRNLCYELLNDRCDEKKLFLKTDYAF